MVSRREIVIGGLASGSGLSGLWLMQDRAPSASPLPEWALHKPRLSIIDHGAIGDGRHDDALAVQRTIDRAGASGGGIIHFPAGNFLLDRQITLRDNIVVSGAAGARIIVGKSFAGLERPLFKSFSGSVFTAAGNPVARRNLAFIGLEIDGRDEGMPGRLLPTAMMHGVMICLGGWEAHSGVENILVRDCHFHSFAGAGIMAWRSQNITITGNIFKNFFANDRLSIGSGIDLHEANRVLIQNNAVDHSAAGLSWHGMVILDWDHSSSEVTISNNIVSNLNGGDGISCEGNKGPGSNLDRAHIFENIIKNCHGQGIGIDNCRDVTVTKNDISNVTGPGIFFTGTTSVIINNNTIKGSGLGGITSQSGTKYAQIRDNLVQAIRYTDREYRGDGINVTVKPDARVDTSNNQIVDIDGAGIYQTSGTIRGNIVRSAGLSERLDVSLRAGIVAAVPAEVLDNVIISDGRTAYAVSSAASDFPTIADNQIQGTFAAAYFYIAYRVGQRIGVSITAQSARYDAAANVFSGVHPGIPSGYWFKNDRIAPPQGHAEPSGWQVIQTPSHWQRR